MENDDLVTTPAGTPLSQLLELNPCAVLAAVGQGSNKLPCSDAHACAFRIDIEMPLPICESELVPRRRGTRWCGIDWSAHCRGITPFDRLQTMHAGLNRTSAARSTELDRDCARKFERAQWCRKTSARFIGSTDWCEEP